MPLTLEVQIDTYLKQNPVQSSDLIPANKQKVLAGELFGITKWETLDQGDDVTTHIKISLESPVKGKYAWYAYQRHVAVTWDGQLIYPAPEDDPAAAVPVNKTATYSGKKLQLPGGLIVFTDQPIITGGSFSWGEATHGGDRLPVDAATADRMTRLAQQLQTLRDKIGRPVRVTSWYRPEPFNSKAGGAKYSQHLNGGAVDIAIAGMTGRQIAIAVKPWWRGGIGVYPGDRRHICHLDIGPKRSWGI